MELYHIEGHRYYRYEDIQVKHSSLVKSCKTHADFVNKRNVPRAQWDHARYKDNEWLISDGKSKKYDKLFIRAVYFCKNLWPQSVKYPKLPDELELEEEEMFHDAEGSALEIKTVGKRTARGVYFSAKDVSKAFGIKDLVHTLAHKDSTYREKEHYRRFHVHSPGIENLPNGRKEPELYLTYNGILKVLYTTRGQKTAPFISWATETLFAAQMGTAKQKQKLASVLCGLIPEAVKEICSAKSGTTPCIYLYSIGTVADLREVMDIDDDMCDTHLVYKYGSEATCRHSRTSKTNDLARRTREHANTYGKLKGAQIKLVYHGYIDLRYMTEAEAMVRSTMQGLDYQLEYDGHKELVIIPPQKMAFVKKQYDMIAREFQGHVTELVAKLDMSEQRIKEIEGQCREQLLIKDKEILIKDNEILSQTIQLLTKDNEILQLRLQASLTQ